MGKRNRERRAAKVKARVKARSGRRPSAASWPDGTWPGAAFHSASTGPALGGAEGRAWYEDVEAIELTLMMAGHAVATGDERAAAECASELSAADSPIDARLLSQAATRYLCTSLGEVWQGGWQPADLAAIVGRRRTARHLALIVALIEEEVRQYAAGTVHPRWRAQLANLGADPWPSARSSEGTTPERPLNLGSQPNLMLAIEILGLLMTLPNLQILQPQPGTYRADRADQAPIDERALARVRALLAKAESSEFPDEAEALSAKAQQLMARHALTRIVVESRAQAVQPVIARRLWLDAPYVSAKSLLVTAVAGANRCRAVWTEALGFTTIVGEGPDLDAVELLSTSLLVQANRGMLDHGQQRNRYGESRTRSFRQSFLLAYASRIGERLRGATEAAVKQVVDEAAADARLLPVLRAQSERVNAACEELFPNMYSQGMSITNGAGWAAGRAAADVALFDVTGAIAS